MGQKCPKRLRRPAGKTTHEHMGRIVPSADITNARNSVKCCDGARVVAANSRSVCSYYRNTVEQQ
jgi:hypothetical protein